MIHRDKILGSLDTTLGDILPEASISLHEIVIDDPESAKVAVGGIVVIRERKMKPGLKPPGWFTDVQGLCRNK